MEELLPGELFTWKFSDRETFQWGKKFRDNLSTEGRFQA